MSFEIDRCYAILGVGYGASSDELKVAYRDLVREWHPDKHQHDSKKQTQAEERLKQINVAYERLKDYKPAPAARSNGPRAGAPATTGTAAYSAHWQRASATAGPRPAEEDDQTLYARAQARYEEGKESFEVRSDLAGPPFLLTDSCAPNEIRSSRPLDAACSSAIGLM